MHFAENTVHSFEGNQEEDPGAAPGGISHHVLPREGARGWRGAHVHEGRVDVVAALAVDGDEEGQAAVGRQDVHAAVLLVVTGQQCDAAVFHAQGRRHHVQGLGDRAGMLGTRPPSPVQTSRGDPPPRVLQLMAPLPRPHLHNEIFISLLFSGLCA